MEKPAFRYAGLATLVSAVAVLCLLVSATLRLATPIAGTGEEALRAAVGAATGGATDFAREPRNSPTEIRDGEGESELDRTEMAVEPWRLATHAPAAAEANASARDRDANERRASGGAVVLHIGRGPPHA